MRELYAIPSEHLILAGLKVDNHYLYPAYNTRGEIRINTLGNTSVEQQYLSYFSDVNKEDDYLCGGIEKILYILDEYIKNKGIKEIIIAWVQAMKS